ncbi:23S rRNA (uracil(1939)-C(5))-methyltransferase RlmD [Alkalilimnicola sp. S0819]|uniref:23S rRNA (uracil(1939)-C(5))-methyltransferase RlmD n=1 Tax=Alkalilimnicola sp. S0819 TaxID=2613922 RepID=UPI001261C5B4|nr:23S rRNA (uracil(1939)-C(5))-methyltransferase RlmD [Alkalilimnicola sp. S0819]KAB7627567.1 23S rRNA (uracil(1939)-C(5))-methyltransferase RlmD [Alkalilimnicola sp. S0819]MPQ15724.1 23S rRNA (uracil(1939)-C(5))-methyltransferase RlmD [Alkalilimnicola sp. S0819]
MSRRRRNRLPQEPVEALTEKLSHEGRGLAHVDGKPVFIHGALAGERVMFQYTKRRRGVADGKLLEVLEAAPDRIEPRCPHFGLCGGCSLQQLTPEDQIAFKQSVLLEQFRQIGGVEPERVLAPLTGPVWGYRGKARLAARYVAGKGDRVLVGFREKHSPYVADLSICHVLDPRVGECLPALAELIGGLSVYRAVPQIEVAVADNAVALVFRNLEPFTEADLQRLSEFGQAHGFRIYQQPGNESSIAPVWPAEPESLYYRIPDYDVEVRFRPSDFTQVNQHINQRMIARALELLAPSADSRVLDLFCGLGNFTMPLARVAGQVTGVEGAEELVARARENAAHNGLSNVDYHVANLMHDQTDAAWLKGDYDRVLLDPPRSGALEMIPHIAKLGAERIVYVSCGPATLARDAGLLVKEFGYQLRAAGVMDMFPHTAHVESIALFER